MLTFEEFMDKYVQEHQALFHTELGMEGQFDELIYFAYDDYVEEQNK